MGAAQGSVPVEETKSPPSSSSQTISQQIPTGAEYFKTPAYLIHENPTPWAPGVPQQPGAITELTCHREIDIYKQKYLGNKPCIARLAKPIQGATHYIYQSDAQSTPAATKHRNDAATFLWLRHGVGGKYLGHDPLRGNIILCCLDADDTQAALGATEKGFEWISSGGT